VAPSAAFPTEGSQRKDPLCQGQLSGKGTPLPTAEISGAGEPLPPERMETGGGWTWVNFWAAWCVPCREEIPRLLSWQSKLGPGKLRVAFVSLDDDARQLQDFLKAQPKAGLRATHWLHDGKEREEWLAEAGMDVDPELPAHLLVDPAGHVRCRVSGAIEDADFARVREIVGG
jgi:thiol-disulfide isomerase/thioredoxin